MSARKLVLIADDHEGAAALLARVVSSMAPYDTLAAHDGQEAVDISRSRHLDAAVLDIDMPRLSGTQAATLMRQELAEHRPLLIALTGRTDLHEVNKTGIFDHVMQKPVHCDVLMRHLQDI